jgi:carbon storage regulator
MLILTRRPGERVVIGEDVLVTVMEVSGQTVRLGIAAPQGLPIYREEIWLAVKEENRAAAEAPADTLPAEAPSAVSGSAHSEGPAPALSEPRDAPPREGGQRPS